MRPGKPWSIRASATLKVMGGACLISFSAVFVTMARTEPTVSAFYRMVLGGAILVALTLIKGERLFLGWRHFMTVAVAGLVMAVDLSLWHRSIRFVGPGLATLLANFQVFFVAAAGALFFRERMSWKLVLAIPMAVGGLYLIVGLEWGGFSSDYKTGVVLGLMAACCYTGYLLLLRSSQSSSTTWATITMATVCTAVFLGLFSAIHRESFVVPDLKTWIVLAVYALVSQVLGWLLITSGIGRIEASRVGLALLLQPTLAFVWDVLFFHRAVTQVEFIGAFLALFAIYLGTMGYVPKR